MKFWGILVIILGVFGLSGFFILNNLNNSSLLSQGQKAKALQSILGRQVHLSDQNTSTNWLIHKSKYVEFSYPSWSRIYSKDDQKAMQDKTILDAFSFNISEEHIYGVVQVVSFTEALTEFPSVNIRLLQKDNYTITKSSSTEIDFSKDADTFERTAFIKGNNDVVSVAITGYSKENVENIFNKVLKSLKLPSS